MITRSVRLQARTPSKRVSLGVRYSTHSVRRQQRLYANTARDIVERCWGTINDTRFSVRFGDITLENSDAIVNAANKMLRHGGGLAAAIVRRGGNIIQQESDEYIAAHGPLADGSACVTSAGSLAAQYVIHAVGPVWYGGASGEEELLRSAILSALSKAKELGVKSIAIPAVSSGIFGFPKERCADIIVSTAVEFANRPANPVVDIRFTNYDEPTVMHFEKAFKRYIPHVQYISR